MRLLNTTTLTIKYFYTDIPSYAILSHTWQKEEVLFRDIQNLEIARCNAGYANIENACARARQYSFEWIWIDSCCVNPENVAELSKVIASMYRYYEDAGLCYVYLCDVSVSNICRPRDIASALKESRWFKRGWTLQELLAPKQVVFLDQNWTTIGTRWSLRKAISAVTAIPVAVFEGSDIHGYSVGQRISMPLLYGEGVARAFKRLKQEIYKTSGDHNIFSLVSVHGSRGWGDTRKYTTAADQTARYTSSDGLDYTASQPTDFANVGPDSAYTQDVAAASQAVFSGAHHNDLKDSTITLVAGHYFSYPVSAAPIGDTDNANCQWKNYAIGGAVGSLATSGAMTLSVAKRTQIAASDLLLEQARVMSYQSMSHSLTSLYQSPRDALPTVALVLTIALRVVQLANGFLKLFRR
ncbi:hypothetical protein D9758_013154 [Tetrapyrgos nigripes]|uniref:Heterokaryon incompatibility domain-containing protein n=1 Tax=Tetrapyrgos nigripes TaxID=182062 RepID=A0A8H5CGG1_9AGAR|nr:hypothetical protein D9758_013154 [Tetrapyrgos nigripes]